MEDEAVSTAVIPATRASMKRLAEVLDQIIDTQKLSPVIREGLGSVLIQLRRLLRKR